MSFSISEIRANLKYGGARPTLFQVSLTSPFNSELTAIAPFMIQATELPASSIGAIEIPFMGRKIRVSGDRTFEPWRINVINDEDFKIRHALETWHNRINSLSGNLNTAGPSPNAYKTNAEVRQYAKTNDQNPIRIYRMYGVFPTDIQAIDLDWNATNQYESFGVTLSYDWYEVLGTTGTVA